MSLAQRREHAVGIAPIGARIGALDDEDDLSVGDGDRTPGVVELLLGGCDRPHPLRLGGADGRSNGGDLTAQGGRVRDRRGIAKRLRARFELAFEGGDPVLSRGQRDFARTGRAHAHPDP